MLTAKSVLQVLESARHVFLANLTLGLANSISLSLMGSDTCEH